MGTMQAGEKMALSFTEAFWDAERFFIAPPNCPDFRFEELAESLSYEFNASQSARFLRTISHRLIPEKFVSPTGALIPWAYEPGNRIFVFWQ